MLHFTGNVRPLSASYVYVSASVCCTLNGGTVSTSPSQTKTLSMSHVALQVCLTRVMVRENHQRQIFGPCGLILQRLSLYPIPSHIHPSPRPPRCMHFHCYQLVYYSHIRTLTLLHARLPPSCYWIAGLFIPTPAFSLGSYFPKIAFFLV